MPAGETDPKNAWVARVLGVHFEGAQTENSAPKERAAGSTVATMQARLSWDTARKRVQAELQKLESAVLADCKDEPDFAEIAANSKVLYTVLGVLDERLIDKLDEVINADAGPARKSLIDEAREIINEYTDYIGSDELLHDIDNNGFIDIAIIPTLTQTLQSIDAQLRAA